MIGIARAFLAAGASTLMASLWPLDDERTNKFMTRFYEQLLDESGGDVAAAMQGAMVSMLRKGYDVSHWAAFSVYGLAEANVEVAKVAEQDKAVEEQARMEEARVEEEDKVAWLCMSPSFCGLYASVLVHFPHT